MNGKYAVANKLQSDAMRTAGMQNGSPGRKAKMRVDAKAVLVIATLIPAAIHKTETCNGTLSGKKGCKARPKQAPANMSGKMKPPRNPPATVKLMATNLAKPTWKALNGVSISNPIKPEVG
mmetsp:Transcript_45511/g.110235  ORF Transcript_45511/g.110235 Transcript_45511/m.110235 type:complete len:121 (-) Transcript_45511:1417-1779(-)